MSDGLPDLHALTRAATVHFLPEDPRATEMWGSGFFVAPGWVLTAAHVLVPYLREDRDLPFRVAGDELQYGIAPTAARLEQWLVTDPWEDIPAQLDLALVRLLDDGVAHECVWIGDRAVSAGGERQVFGFRPTPQDAVHTGSPYGLWRGTVTANVDDGDLAVRFAPQAEFPPGVSGGPVLDPVTGAVLEVVKSGRVGGHGGRAVSAVALRRFGALYREVMASHDRWHHGRHGTTDNWTEHQARLGRDSGAGPERWSSHDRVAALSHLAALAPPHPGVVERLAGHVRNQRLARTGPAPVTWRDGHGLLYDGNGTPLDAYVFLHYLRLVGEWTRARGGDAGGLDAWVDGRLRQLPPHLRRLVEQARLPREESGDRVVIPYPGPDERAYIVVVELDELPYGTVHWQIRIDDGSQDHEIFAAEQDPNGVPSALLRHHLREHLAEAFQVADAAGGGVPAPCEVVLPAGYFDTPVHRWQLADEAPLGDDAHLPLGARRRLVLRNAERRGEPDPRWKERWNAVAESGALAASRLRPVQQPPGSRHFTEMQPSGVPVLCHQASRGVGRRAIGLALDAGHGIALWRIDGHDRGACGDGCEELHRGAAELLALTGSAPELPDRLRRIREDIHKRRTKGHWAEAVAVMYDDPRRPVPQRPMGPVNSP
ncbi:trypsin-like peptidase domain-containing protein [Streptomyces sp. NPDC015127]|uniref:VMAP-C domain-containing protein n=1 Tax=Streptomyces sp. NPDC015127 TaxID=3364939 RepID=UPI0036F5A1A0